MYIYIKTKHMIIDTYNKLKSFYVSWNILRPPGHRLHLVTLYFTEASGYLVPSHHNEKKKKVKYFSGQESSIMCSLLNQR